VPAARGRKVVVRGRGSSRLKGGGGGPEMICSKHRKGQGEVWMYFTEEKNNNTISGGKTRLDTQQDLKKGKKKGKGPESLKISAGSSATKRKKTKKKKKGLLVKPLKPPLSHEGSKTFQSREKQEDV